MKQSELKQLQKKVSEFLEERSIILTEQEKKNIEITDVGLNEFPVQGMGLITYINNDQYCAKELVLFGGQTFVQHKHPPINEYPGKRETFRCRWGTVYLYVEGEQTNDRKAVVPRGSEEYYTVFHEIILTPGEQYTIEPDTWHWFQAGSEGAIISEFSTTSYDEADVFTDPRVKRIQEITNE